MKAVGVGSAPTYPTLTAAPCRVRSAAFPEGSAEKRGKKLCPGHRKPHNLRGTKTNELQTLAIFAR